MLALSAVLSVAAGCAATPPSESVRLATAIEAERDGRFAAAPRQHAPQVVVHSESSEAVPRDFAAQAAEIRSQFRALLGQTGAPVPPLTILVFENPRRLQTSLAVSAGVHGLALTRIDDPTIVLAAGEGHAALQRHLRHEIAHIVSNLAAQSDLPPGRAAWVEEGLAYLLEWTEGDEPPRPSAALLHLLNDRAPNPALVPQLMSAHYRPRGNAGTMRRLAAGAATLVHYYWDRAARERPGEVDVAAMLETCARRTPGELHHDAAAWTAHWRRLHRLARARESADVAARFLEAYVAGARVAGAKRAAVVVRPLAERAASFAHAAHRASAPGADLTPEDRSAAHVAQEKLRAFIDTARAADPAALDDELHRMLVVAHQQFGVAVAAGDDAAGRPGAIAPPTASPAPR